MDTSQLITKNTDLSPLKADKCDKWDYMIAAGCGAVAGLVDVFLVGAPGDSVLGAWTDKQVDNCVMHFAKLNGWSPRAGKEGNVKSAIGYLENKFPVNYDQSTSLGKRGTMGAVDKLSPKNHHMKSLAHSPDILGLFFSVLNQFTSTSTFVSGGKIITIDTETFELQGGNFISKLFCGVTNWFGHLMSDVAGSSGAKGRGSGICIPFFELFELCDFGKFGQHRQNLAQVATQVFEMGYDFRHGLTMTIPVVLCNLSIRLIWAVRRFFQYKKPLIECIPTSSHNDLRVMLLIGHGTLCSIDGIDALLRSGGNIIQFFLRLNIVAWFVFIKLAIKEILIRAGVDFMFERTIETLKRVNLELKAYLAELEKYDLELYQKEVDAYEAISEALDKAHDAEALKDVLYIQLEKAGLEVPWKKTHDSFDDFMMDKNARLVFK